MWPLVQEAGDGYKSCKIHHPTSRSLSPEILECNLRLNIGHRIDLCTQDEEEDEESESRLREHGLQTNPDSLMLEITETEVLEMENELASSSILRTHFIF